MNSIKVKSHFPLFQTPVDLAHSYWEKLLQPKDWVIDATCGNGKDALKLAQIVSEGGVIALDIQKIALETTEALLETHLNSKNYYLFLQDHKDFPEIALATPIRLVVYNFGYLPGGDKTLTTLVSSTLISLEKALCLIIPGGAISLVCYPGHPEGLREQEALLAFVKELDPSKWSVCIHFWNNRVHSPSFIFIQKAISYS